MVDSRAPVSGSIQWSVTVATLGPRAHAGSISYSAVSEWPAPVSPESAFGLLNYWSGM
jgi:hypothetical protein